MELGELKSEKSERSLNVSAELKARMLQVGNDEWIFPCMTGERPLEPSNALRKIVRPACRRLGIGLGGWHDFRHTATTTMRKNGIHPTVIAAVLGHSGVDLQMNVYDRADAADIGAALVTLGNNLNPKIAQNQPNSRVSVV
jgi:integrase